MILRLLSVASIVLLSACAQSDPGWNSLHPKTTENCTRWLDGSYYPVDGSDLGKNDIGASRPRMTDGAPELEFVFFVARGESIRLDSLNFSAVSPPGTLLSIGRPSLWLNPRTKGETPRYSELSMELVGSADKEDRSLYVVVVRFSESLPSRFDVVLPDVWLRGKKYPVRTFGYNFFPDKQQLGLCN